MPTRLLRNTAALAALLFGLMAVIASSAAAQDATPGATPSVQQPVTVGNTDVTWTGDWQYDASSSMKSQVSLNQIDQTTGILNLATYGEFADKTVDTPDGAIDAFAQAFFNSAGVQEDQQVGNGDLENGAVWKLYNFNLQGLKLSLVITANQPSSGDYVISTLTANTTSFQDTVEQAQQEIMLNGEPVFLEEFDPAEVASNLATPAASPVASPEA